MTTTTRVGMPLDEFIESFDQQPFELIEGERRILIPGLAEHTETIVAIFQAIYSYLINNKGAGTVLPEATFVLPDRYDANWVTGSRTPDVVVYQGERLDDYKKSNSNWRRQPYLIVPDLVVEVISFNDKLYEVEEKIAAYRADGVRIVWQVNLKRRIVNVFTAESEEPQVVKIDGVLDGGDVLPGFTLPLAQVFAEI